MKADGGSLKLTATNLEMAASCIVRGKVDEQGEFTVPAKLFLDYVGLLPSEQVDLEVVGNELRIRCGRYETKMNGLPASEFPLIPSVVSGEAYTVPAKELKDTIGQVLFAVATNEARPELSGVNVSFHAAAVGRGKATFAATDSYRLSERVLDIGGSATPSSVIIPPRTLSEVGRILSVFKDDVEVPEHIEITIAENQMLVRYGSVELTSRTIDGTYPDYRQIIPAAFKTEARVGAQGLGKAIKTASLFSRTGLYDVHLAFLPTEKGISVRGADASRGENTAVCEADVSGDPTQVTLNYRYVLDGLQALGSEEAVFQLVDGANPCVIRPSGPTPNFLYIVMPIKQ